MLHEFDGGKYQQTFRTTDGTSAECHVGVDAIMSNATEKNPGRKQQAAVRKEYWNMIRHQSKATVAKEMDAR
jgi:hypothetical protein